MIDNLRSFLDQLAAARPDPQSIEALSADLSRWTGRLAPMEAAERDRLFGRCTNVPGRAQTMAPRLVVTGVTDDAVTASVCFGPYFLGGNGAAHGGAIPLVFDEIMGRLANSAGRPAQRTAFLHTDFRSITPIGRPLKLRARLFREEGRKRWIRGELHDGDLLCAEAEGLFVALRPGQP
ncbi:thioesterase [Mycobacterium sp. E796]|nr:thioesterase [Mycobacterium sp. E796]